MRWRPMPPHTPPTVTTAQSWPTARAAGGHAREPRPGVSVCSSRPASAVLFRAGARQVAAAPLDLVAHGPASLAIHGCVQPFADVTFDPGGYLAPSIKTPDSQPE